MHAETDYSRVVREFDAGSRGITVQRSSTARICATAVRQETCTRAVRERLKADPVWKTWRGNRTLLKNLKHFPKYRKDKYDLYHEAARASMRGTATGDQEDLVQGLEKEIDESRVVVPTCQILFHGRANREITSLKPYPSFISTSLHPVVARQSALRRAGVNNQKGRPTVYVLTLRCSLPALWGQIASSSEYELLLPRKLELISTSVHTTLNDGGSFDVVEAEVLGRG